MLCDAGISVAIQIQTGWDLSKPSPRCRLGRIGPPPRQRIKFGALKESRTEGGTKTDMRERKKKKKIVQRKLEEKKI
jgi:hypothetical protein